MDIKSKKPKQSLIFYYVIVLVVLFALNFLIFPSIRERSIVETTYDQFIDYLDEKKVTEVQLEDDGVTIYYVVDDNGKEIICKTGRVSEDYHLIDRLDEAGVKFAQVIPTQASPILSFLISWIIPIGLFALLGWWISTKMASSMGGGPGGSMMF